MSTETTVIDDSSLPALFNAADRASLNGQFTYLVLVRADLVLMLLGALASSWSGENAVVRSVTAWIGAALLFASFFATWAILVQFHERVWYGQRAVAESVKSLAWRYMTRAEPFNTGAESEVDNAFVSSLRELLGGRDDLGASLAVTNDVGDQITSGMRSVRGFDMPQRLSSYLSQRIVSQKQWYAKKAKMNHDSRWKWFMLVLVLQLTSAVLAIVAISFPAFPLSLSPVLASAATAAIAWMQVKRHQELAQSYAVAAQDLSMVEATARAISSEESLSTFVGDAETAISREHTLWVARRDAASVLNAKR